MHSDSDGPTNHFQLSLSLTYQLQPTSQPASLCLTFNLQYLPACTKVLSVYLKLNSILVFQGLSDSKEMQRILPKLSESFCMLFLGEGNILENNLFCFISPFCILKNDHSSLTKIIGTRQAHVRMHQPVPRLQQHASKMDVPSQVLAISQLVGGLTYVRKMKNSSQLDSTSSGWKFQQIASQEQAAKIPVHASSERASKSL